LLQHGEYRNCRLKIAIAANLDPFVNSKNFYAVPKVAIGYAGGLASAVKNYLFHFASFLITPHVVA
jgi:hypothetical protein